mmetsp:Transcript_5373/g.11028  ORF Transcript_5373/g.11028 Transcript_5373/m.11028 type:complete len:685 (-) Transcript_5373:156-2210(-)
MVAVVEEPVAASMSDVPPVEKPRAETPDTENSVEKEDPVEEATTPETPTEEAEATPTEEVTTTTPAEETPSKPTTTSSSSWFTFGGLFGDNACNFGMANTDTTDDVVIAAPKDDEGILQEEPAAETTTTEEPPTQEVEATTPVQEETAAPVEEEAPTPSQKEETPTEEPITAVEEPVIETKTVPEEEAPNMEEAATETETATKELATAEEETTAPKEEQGEEANASSVMGWCGGAAATTGAVQEGAPPADAPTEETAAQPTTVSDFMEQQQGKESPREEETEKDATPTPSPAETPITPPAVEEAPKDAEPVEETPKETPALLEEPAWVDDDTQKDGEDAHAEEVAQASALAASGLALQGMVTQMKENMDSVQCADVTSNVQCGDTRDVMDEDEDDTPVSKEAAAESTTETEGDAPASPTTSTFSGFTIPKLEMPNMDLSKMEMPEMPTMDGLDEWLLAACTPPAECTNLGKDGGIIENDEDDEPTVTPAGKEEVQKALAELQNLFGVVYPEYQDEENFHSQLEWAAEKAFDKNITVLANAVGEDVKAVSRSKMDRAEFIGKVLSKYQNLQLLNVGPLYQGMLEYKVQYEMDDKKHVVAEKYHGLVSGETGKIVRLVRRDQVIEDVTTGEEKKEEDSGRISPRLRKMLGLDADDKEKNAVKTSGRKKRAFKKFFARKKEQEQTKA